MADGSGSKFKRILHWSPGKKEVRKFLLYSLGIAFFLAIIGLKEISFLILALNLFGGILASFLLVGRAIFRPDLDNQNDESESMDDFINRM